MSSSSPPPSPPNKTRGMLSRLLSFFGSVDSDTDASDKKIPQEVIEYSGNAGRDEIAFTYAVLLQADKLILHSPKEGFPPSSKFPPYNIILHTNTPPETDAEEPKLYSLFRTKSESEAGRVFQLYRTIFLDLIQASFTSFDKPILEKILEVVSKQEYDSGVYVAAALDMVEQLRSPIFQLNLFQAFWKSQHTPLEVACVHGKLEAFRTILELAGDDEESLARLRDHVDVQGNNLAHLAAASEDGEVGKQILILVKQKLLQLHKQVESESGEQEIRNIGWESILELFQKRNNPDGLMPIHVACQLGNLEVVQELALFGDVPLLDVKADKDGRTPLHLATSHPAVLAHLLSLGADPNVADNDGLTPLHKAVISKELKSAIYLLANKADPNVKATSEMLVNVTPLHLAANVCAVDCMKLLIVFGADMEVKDGQGHTPRHIVATVSRKNPAVKQEALFVLSAAGAQRCEKAFLRGCSEGCKSEGGNDGRRPDNWRITVGGPGGGNTNDNGPTLHEAMKDLGTVSVSDKETSQLEEGGTAVVGTVVPAIGGRLLSLDGGGIRALALTQMLSFMEQEFHYISGVKIPLISHFDWVAGTGTGGILALALASGKSASEVQSMCFKLKEKIFTGPRPHCASKLEAFLKEELGPEVKMSSVEASKLMVMTSLANQRPSSDLHIFRNYPSPLRQLGRPEEHPQFPEETYVWEAAKASGVAPPYFEPGIDQKFMDGAVISNNPTLDALSEMVQYKAVAKATSQQNSNGPEDTRKDEKVPSLVLSLGTGSRPPPPGASSSTDPNLVWPTGILDAAGLTKLVNLLVDQSTQSEGQVVERARAWCASLGVPYLRLSPEIGKDVEFDEINDELLVNLMWETWCYMVANREAVRELYHNLVKN